MMTPILMNVGGEEVEVSCAQRRAWPPSWARLGATPEDMRSRFTPEQYERAKTWERVCGLLAMDASKCASCPMARLPSGKPVVPPAPKAPFRLERPSMKGRKEAR